MLCAPFYQVNVEAYLFPERVKASNKRKKLEEPVRQRCAFELVRAYGISITDIEFERSTERSWSDHSKSLALRLLERNRWLK